MRTLLLVHVMCLLFVTNMEGQMNDSLEQKFRVLESNWMTAWKNRDESTLRNVLADEFTLTSSLSKGNLVDKEEWIDKAMNHYECREFSIEKLRVHLYENTAVVNISFRQEAMANGKDWSGDFLLTDVWVRKNDQWQVVCRHASWLVP